MLRICFNSVCIENDRIVGVLGASRKIHESVMAYPGVTAHPHRYGGVEYRLGNREIAQEIPLEVGHLDVALHHFELGINHGAAHHSSSSLCRYTS